MLIETAKRQMVTRIVPTRKILFRFSKRGTTQIATIEAAANEAPKTKVNVLARILPSSGIVVFSSVMILRLYMFQTLIELSWHRLVKVQAIRVVFQWY